MSDSNKLGISGRIAGAFLTSQLTPLLALAALLLGLLAVLVTPREEEPQIDVTFANVFIPFPGATAREVEHLITTPAEQILSEIEGVKHIYSTSQPGMAVLTVEYAVGEDRTQAIVRLYNAVFSKQDWLPAHLGAGSPIIKPKGIDDVPILTATLWSRDPNLGAYELGEIAHTIEAELKRVPGTRDIYTVGAPERVAHVLIDPAKLAGYGLGLTDLRDALQATNQSAEAGSLVRDGLEIPVRAGILLGRAEELGELIIGMHQGAPFYLADVAEIRLGPDQPTAYVRHGSGAADPTADGATHPAVTIAVAKKPGTNAVEIANAVVERFEHLRGVFIPDGVEVSITRNYGQTADAKAKTLIKKLVFATGSVVLLVLIALGWREAIVVGAAVVATLALTLFASWAWGFTLNRVSLFALIFSIGILVDDAIVVVENIHRHKALGKGSLLESIPRAVDEVGGPTILATFTVIAALLPMAFVTGLMGPYMSPIPINASIGMVLSLAIAFIFTPWFTRVMLSGIKGDHDDAGEPVPARLYALFKRVVGPFLRQRQGIKWRFMMGVVVLALILASVSLAAVQLVVLKMLPFDNKSEFQVVLDMPEGTPLEQTARVLAELGAEIGRVAEVADYQIYAGTAAPINFNGLVRQYYLREGANVGDIQVNLVDKSQRDRKSHDIARAMRAPLQQIGARYRANVKVVEVPPGPPVFAPLVAEIYGIDYDDQRALAKQVRKVFEDTPDIVDVDDMVGDDAPRLLLAVDRARAARLGLSQAEVAANLSAALSGNDATYLHIEHVKHATPVRLELPAPEQGSLQALLDIELPSRNGQMISLGEVVRVIEDQRERAIYHKDLLPVVYVVGDMAGPLDSPLYGMAQMYQRIADQGVAGKAVEQYLINPPETPYRPALKWDGEWQVTYETFRDMGLAYSLGLVLIYFLVVAQFKSYVVPLIIMAPIPLTVIGVMPGHALVGAQFTATSMIGMIALAGIIVRNSILLVDFINQQVDEGVPFEEAVLRSGAVRAKPIVLTGLAAVLGAFFILDDPIFSGLAISLIFGIFVSTVLTLVVIPVLYYAAFWRKMA